jgi:hypothetical protein
MPRFSPALSDFISGEIAPLSYGKVKEERYEKGLATSLNGIPTLEGGWVRRAGTKYVYPAKNNAPTKLIPFKYTSTVAFMLEFGQNYIRFHTRSGPVLNGGTPLEIFTPYTLGDVFTLSYCQNLKVLYLACPGKPPYKLIYNPGVGLGWTLSPISFLEAPYGFDTSSIIYAPALRILDVTAGAPLHGSTNLVGTSVSVVQVQTYQIVASGGFAAMSFPIPAMAWLETGDYVSIAGLTTGSAYNGVWQITVLSTTSFILNGSTAPGATITDTGGSILDLSWVNKKFCVDLNVSFFRVRTAAANTIWNYGPINFIGNALIGGLPTEFSFARSDLFNLFYNTQTFANEYMTPAWGNFVAGPQYPTCVCFHESRLWFGGGNAKQLIFGSNINKFENFAPTQFAANSGSDNTVITDACAVSFAFASKEATVTNWIVSDEKGLIVGTSGGPWVVRPNTLTDAITPTNISAKQLTGYPASSNQPAVVGKSVVYVDTAARIVRELAYFFSIDGFRAVELSEYYNHIASPGVATEIVYQNVPVKCVWFARSDGTLVSITYDRTQDNLRMGWSRHILGGQSDTGGTPPVPESLAVIPSPDGVKDDVWMSVHRYVNGASVRYIEYVEKVFEVFNAPQEAYFVDCGIMQDTPIDIQNATNGSVTTFQSTAHGLSTGDQVRLRNIVGLAVKKGQYSVLNDKLYTVTVIDSSHFSVPENSTALTAFVITDAVALGLPGRAQVRKMVTAVTGLLHLKGEVVSVIGDGADLGDYTVNGSGAITLTQGAGQIQVGLNFVSDMQLLRLEGGSSDGTSIGKFRRMNEVGFMVDRSAAFKYGAAFGDAMLDINPIRTYAMPMDQAAALFSGISDNNSVDFDYDLDNRLCVRQDRPLPLCMLAILPQQVAYDKT